MDNTMDLPVKTPTPRRRRNIIIGSSALSAGLLICVCLAGLLIFGNSSTNKNATGTRVTLTQVAQAPTVTPTINVGPTQTRVQELAILATAMAPTVTPSPTNTPPPPTATPAPPTATIPPPTSIPVPPTATAIPPTAVPPTPVPPAPLTATPVPPRAPTTAPVAAAGTWNGVPLYPGAILYQNSSANSSVYASTDPVATIDAWYKREWTRAGLTYFSDLPQDNLTFHIYSRSGAFYGYAVREVSPGIVGIAMILGKP